MRHASFVANDSKKIHASPRLPTRGFTTSNAIGATNSDGRSTLPTLGGQANGRGQSPNVAKRTGWTTPRTVNESVQGPGTPDEAEVDYEDVDDYAESVKIFQQQRPKVGPMSSESIPTENALEILEAVARENESQSEVVHQRSWLLQRTESQHLSETKEHGTQQLAYLEQMYATIQLLQKDLDKERRRCSSASNNTELAAVMSESTHGYLATGPNVTTLAKSSKRVDIPAKVLQSPLRIRLGHGPTPAQQSAQAELQTAVGRKIDMRIRARLTEKSVLERERRDDEFAQKHEFSSDILISTREQKLRETLNEKIHWQHEYEVMRDQVVEEKTRQVELFRRLEKSKRDHLLRTENLERALQACCIEIELLRSQVAETRMCVVHQKRTMEDLAKHAKDEKEKLVCSIAETRHKFKEWKEGEAGTLKAARDQAVHNLKTEYELKIARHHEEKQKLRDKVKDLEVSLRLLQKDRNLSPVELSLRKATILGSKDGGSTTEAELIEASSRIKELEALLNHAKEYQKRQENIIRVSESTISRLMQEREVVALENLTLQPLAGLSPSIPLSLTKAVDSTDSAASSRERHSMVLQEPLTGFASVTTATSLGGEHAMEGTAALAGPSFVSASIHAQNLHKGKNSDTPASKRKQSGAAAKYGQNTDAGLSHMSSSKSIIGTPLRANDPEKEILRRQSIVLSAEIDKYRQIVVHSLDEIRTLKDSRRRSHHGMLLNGQNGTASLKEQYLMGEVIKLQAELEAVKAAHKKKERVRRKKTCEQAKSDVDSSSNSSSDSGSESDSEKSSSESEKDNQSARAVKEGSDIQEAVEETEEQSDHEETTSTQKVPALPDTESLSSLDSSSFDPSAFSELTPVDSLPPEPKTTKDMEVAVKVIQNKSKTFLLRRDFIKQKIAISKIKARYRGYLVRKNVELLDRHHQKQFIVSQAMQYKMEIVDPHHEITSKCHGILFKLVIRVSKDPPIVQIQMASIEEPELSKNGPLSRFDAPMHEDFQGVQVIFFHLFEIIALLPHEEESIILEKSSEAEIAMTFASVLSVVRVGGQYKFSIKRRRGGSIERLDHRVQFNYLPGSNGGSILSELPVERTPGRITSHRKTSGAQREESADDARELEDLIRKARIPLADDTVQLDFDGIESNISNRADHIQLKKILRRMSSTSLEIIPESPRTATAKPL